MKKSFLLVLVAACSALSAWAQPQIVAHRGFWNTEGSAQNSLTALQKAADLGLYGSEFDVWLTADDVPVVFHDDKWDGLSIQDSKYAELMNRQLPNGEFLPTLQQYLQLGKKLPYTRLVLEIKTHREEARNLKAAETCVQLMNQLGLGKQVEFIAFSRYVCEQLHRLAPDHKVAYLNGDLSPKQVKELGLTGIDYHMNVLRKHPEWLKEAKKLGVEVNVWTVNGKEALAEFAHMEGVDLITTNDPHLLKEMLKEK